MAQTPPPNIDPVPTPPIQRGDRATFSSRVDAFILWLVNAVTQFRNVATNVYNNAVDAFNSATGAASSATAAGTSAGQSATSATNAGNSATDAGNSATAAATSAGQAATSATNAATSATASANSALALTATSTSSNTITTGNKTFTVQAGKQFVVGAPIVAVNAASSSQFMAGTVESYSGASLTINVTAVGGSGTVANWNITVSGVRGLQGIQGPTGNVSGGTLAGALNEARAGDIASASTINLTNATGNLVHIAGTNTINTITLQSGAERSVIFDGALTLTNGSGLLLPGAANIVTQAGDRALIRGDTNGAVVTHYQRADGNSVAPSAFTPIASVTISTSVTNINFLNSFTAAFDKYAVEIEGLTSAGTGVLQIRFANGGAVDAGARYRVLGANRADVDPPRPQLGFNQMLSGSPFTATFTVRNANAGTGAMKVVDLIGAAQSNANSPPTISSTVSLAVYLGGVVSGLQLSSSTGDPFTAGIIRIYGVRNV